MTDWNGDGKYDYRDDTFYHEVIKGEQTGGSNKKTSGRNVGIAWTGILIRLFTLFPTHRLTKACEVSPEQLFL